MRRPLSLFRRTLYTIVMGLLIFQLISGLAVFINIVLPLGNRSANDLADLLLLSARIWSNLPVDQRLAFQTELQDKHNIKLRESTSPLTENDIPYPYIHFLRKALINRLAENQLPRLSEDDEENFQVEFTYQQKKLRFEFSLSRIPPRPSRALVWIVGTGFLAAIALSWLLARRVSAPVARLAEAAKKIGGTDEAPLLPETGDVEFVDLARIFNDTSRQLQAQKENQSTLLAGVSHDLRSPLARMKMASGMLSEQYSSPLLNRMASDIEEMDKLIGAQLDLARAGQGEKLKTTNVDELLYNIVLNAQNHSPGQIQLCPLCSPCVIKLAPLALRRCINNLLDNALRYSGDAKIEVIRRRLNKTIFIGIHDHGPGIPTHLAEAVFRPFYRIETSRNRNSGGSGLGLAITRQIADTQGWKVLLRSRRNGGLSAWLLIPEI